MLKPLTPLTKELISERKFSYVLAALFTLLLTVLQTSGLSLFAFLFTWVQLTLIFGFIITIASVTARLLVTHPLFNNAPTSPVLETSTNQSERKDSYDPSNH